MEIKTLNGINFSGLEGTYFVPRYALIKNENGDIILTCSDGSESAVSGKSVTEERLAALEAAMLEITNANS